MPRRPAGVKRRGNAGTAAGDDGRSRIPAGAKSSKKPRAVGSAEAAGVSDVNTADLTLVAKIQEWYGMELPPEFYSVFAMAQGVAPDDPCNAFAPAGVRLVGPYEVLAGMFDGKAVSEVCIHIWQWGRLSAEQCVSGAVCQWGGVSMEYLGRRISARHYNYTCQFTRHVCLHLLPLFDPPLPLLPFLSRPHALPLHTVKFTMK